jgi:hypothetical protein
MTFAQRIFPLAFPSPGIASQQHTCSSENEHCLCPAHSPSRQGRSSCYLVVTRLRTRLEGDGEKAMVVNSTFLLLEVDAE